MVNIDFDLKPKDLEKALARFWELSGEKIHAIEKEYPQNQGSPVFTVNGKYATRGWTEWTQGFQFGSSILQFDATGEASFLEKGRLKTLQLMAPHTSHTGVHDHGFNNVSTYGNLLRLMVEEKIPYDEWEKNFYELALKVSGAVQASRWTDIKGGGFIYSFNGPHSLFVDTIRTVRILMLSYSLGHVLQEENDRKVNLLVRGLQHAKATADYSVFYGKGRDRYDLWGRTAHESVFNTNDGNFRCPNSQQGYTGFSTWTRGLAWAMCGFAEELEYIDTLTDKELEAYGTRSDIEAFMLQAAEASCDFYIEHTPTDGIPYWDTGAPNLHKLGDYLSKPADPYNAYEPVDSSAAAIGAQGLLRLGHYLDKKGQVEKSKKYWQAGLTVLKTLLQEPYLSTDKKHQGILLHSIYHQPNGWDNVPKGQKIACEESSMWGDYHARELALYVQRIINKDPYYTFFNCLS
ncbi:glycosyl hydrolase [Negadavirga shengliensis]|uniref:Glycosyl hydrolase n=1 Tax=Negadavirga shengliensis TaxID=1389218 RepID=A0ABV9T1M3_9BACT